MPSYTCSYAILTGTCEFITVTTPQYLAHCWMGDLKNGRLNNLSDAYITT